MLLFFRLLKCGDKGISFLKGGKGNVLMVVPLYQL